MKAIVYQRYGSSEVLTLREVEKPAPAANEALLRIRAASVTLLDWHFLTGKPWMARLMAGPLRPTRKILGIDVAGMVEKVGPEFTRFKPGDEVFA